MIDEQTIDRVCVGLVNLAVEIGDEPCRLLFLLLGIPEPIPAWVEHALYDHHGTPEELVAALRELAVENSTKEPTPFPY